MLTSASFRSPHAGKCMPGKRDSDALSRLFLLTGGSDACASQTAVLRLALAPVQLTQ